ncbi:MAG: amidohydrolase family protein, partial [Alphaproteobacteria bacterium]
MTGRTSVGDEAAETVIVPDGVVAATGAAAEVAGATLLDVGPAVLMPGFVNAHQHGRGLSQILLGYPDDHLEAWVNRRRARGLLNAFPLVQLAALRMLANGVTSCLHANWSYGGPHEAELDATLRAYDAAGIRAAVMVGVADRGALIYPNRDEQAFLQSLPAEARTVAATVRHHAFLHEASEAAAIHDRLSLAWRGRPLLSLGFGPAGPQWVSDQLFAEVAAAAKARQAPLHFHLLESPAQAKACAQLYPEGVARRLAQLGILAPNVSAAHGVFLSDDDLQIMASCGVTMVANPGSNLRLGNGAPRYAAWRAAGLKIALGGDDTELADDRDPWGELRLFAALARPGDNASPPGPSALERLAMATEAGAMALGLQGKIGRLVPGFAADVIAVDPSAATTPWRDQDMPLLEAMFARSSGRDIRMTMVAGRVLYRDGTFTHASIKDVAKGAAECAEKARLHP